MADPIKALAEAARDACDRLLACAGSYSDEKEIAHDLFDALAAYDATQSQPQAVPGTNSLEPIVYHLDDGELARGMRIGRSVVAGESTLVVDLTFGDGPSVIGKDGWFQRGYVECYGGLVPESASEGTEPGQWSYGVLKCNREIDTAQAQPAPSDATTPPTDDYDALGHAMEILGRCVTKYSCEQAQAVAKVLRQWRDKWALAVDSIPVAKPAAIPSCEFCEKPMPDPDGHGLGECAPICPTCSGTGSACGQPAPTVAEIEEAVYRFRDVCFAQGRLEATSDHGHSEILIENAKNALLARLRGGAS